MKAKVNTPEIFVSENPAEMAGNEISEILKDMDGKPVLFAIAGGSSLKVLEYIDEKFLGANITVVVTDERVSQELDENNFTSLQATHFYNKLINHDAYCISTELFSGEKSGDLKKRYGQGVENWIKEFPDGVIVALLGIGEDGHTAGLIQGVYSREEFKQRFDGKTLIEELDAKEKNKFRHRITTTFNFLRNHVDFAVFYAEGESKRKAIEKIKSKNGDIYETPARIMLEMKKAKIFTNIRI